MWLSACSGTQSITYVIPDLFHKIFSSKSHSLRLDPVHMICKLYNLSSFSGDAETTLSPRIKIRSIYFSTDVVGSYEFSCLDSLSHYLSPQQMDFHF